MCEAVGNTLVQYPKAASSGVSVNGVECGSGAR